MQGFHHLQGSQQALLVGWDICTTWSLPSVAPSRPATVAWKSQEAPSPHATGCAICTSSRPEACDERGYPLPLNRVECAKTGDLVQIPATQVPWFTAGNAFRALVNQPE